MTDELNLSELFANFVKFISRNSKLLLIIIAIGVVGVIGYQTFKTPYYETKAICMSGISEYERQDQIEDLSQRTAIDLINHLQINIENGDYSALTTLLGVDSNIAATIKKIEAEQLSQEDMNEKFYALNKFEISLTVRDNLKINDTATIVNNTKDTFVSSFISSLRQKINDPLGIKKTK
jgi:predicted negative regulator of RcsB-dependent stress response